MTKFHKVKSRTKMNRFFHFLLIIIIAVSCKSGLQERTPHFNHYLNDWARVVSIAIDKEIVNIPEDCSPLRTRIEQLKGIIVLSNLENNKKIIDSLINITLFSKENTFAIVDRYIQGFNFSHCTTFMMYDKQENLICYLKGCRRDPDPMLVENMPFVVEATANKNRTELDEYIKMKSNCNLDGIFIVTIIDGRFNIKKIKVILMPN